MPKQAEIVAEVALYGPNEHKAGYLWQLADGTLGPWSSHEPLEGRTRIQAARDAVAQITARGVRGTVRVWDVGGHRWFDVEAAELRDPRVYTREYGDQYWKAAR